MSYLDYHDAVTKHYDEHLSSQAGRSVVFSLTGGIPQYKCDTVETITGCLLAVSITALPPPTSHTGSGRRQCSQEPMCGATSTGKSDAPLLAHEGYVGVLDRLDSGVNSLTRDKAMYRMPSFHPKQRCKR